MQDEQTLALDALLLRLPDDEFAELMMQRYADAGAPRDPLAEQRLRRRLAAALPKLAAARH